MKKEKTQAATTDVNTELSEMVGSLAEFCKQHTIPLLVGCQPTGFALAYVAIGTIEWTEAAASVIVNNAKLSVLSTAGSAWGNARKP